MTDSPAVATLGLQADFAQYHEESAGRPSLTVFKILLIATIILFSAIYLPSREANQANLTSGNLLSALNQDRLKNGLPPLVENRQLQSAALAKAHDILARHYFAHTSPSGLQPWDFIKQAGLAYLFAGENLAINNTNTDELERDFLKSPSHRENLLSPLFSEVGIAVVSNKSNGQNAVVTVQMFGSPLPKLAINPAPAN